jgi:hypothetical protein
MDAMAVATDISARAMSAFGDTAEMGGASLEHHAFRAPYENVLNKPY